MKNYWKAKNWRQEKCGRKRKFTPDQLWDEAVKYFDWVEKNPILEEKASNYKGEITIYQLKKPRAMSINRMCSFIGLDYSNYTKYRKDEKYSNTCQDIDTIIRQQKFEGAAAGVFNPVIIARDIGLKEHSDHTSSDGSMTPKASGTVVVTEGDVESILSKL